MPGLSDTLEKLARFRVAGLQAETAYQDSRLSSLAAFGSNPGQLNAKFFVPQNLARDAALVVVLHGCTQTANGYDHGSGWSQIADEQGFALLYPEQQRSNNANLCFNWFEPDDVWRDRGEVLSIGQMVQTMIGKHSIDPAKIFVTGLSAGGAMTSALLAAYPDVFAGGAIIAGLPAGTVTSMSQAFQRMQHGGTESAASLAAKITSASSHSGPWPSVSVWHGDADRTVDRSNADAIVEQWRGVHGLAEAVPVVEVVDGQTRETWRDPNGRVAIESWTITGMGHGTPLDTKSADACGMASPHMLEVSISSTRHIVRFWGLETKPRRQQKRSAADERSASGQANSASHFTQPAASAGPGRVIEDALRAAGLMR
ncbi:LpqC, poly [Sphingomonas antarctica]|uniref:extracellular catalytic domain type 1 short-chain-length polyhydroxyalkanoate depolymerase n=1 Tax=Sphingomonas antarctica TaxID=2040274 RepID=UPI0039E8977B